MKTTLILLLLSTCLHAENRFWKWTSAALIAGNSLDAASSYGHYESNPALRSGSGRFGGKGIALKAGVVGGTLLMEHFILKGHPKNGKVFGIANLGYAGVFSGVAVRNWRMK